MGIVSSVAFVAGCGSGSKGATPASDGGPACPTGSITFKLQVAPGSDAGYCLAGPLVCGGGSTFSVAGADGGAGFGFDTPCLGSCSPCETIACADFCTSPTPMGDGGVEQAWDGTYSAIGTCGASVQCLDTACAPAGDYVATMCGIPASAYGCDDSFSPTECVHVPFTWPPPSGGGAEVVGTLGGGASADAGE